MFRVPNISNWCKKGTVDNKNSGHFNKQQEKRGGKKKKNTDHVNQKVKK